MSAVYYHFRKYFSSWPTEHFFLFIWTLNFIKILSEYMAMIECSFLDREIYCLLKKKKKKEDSFNYPPPCVDPSLNLAMCV